MIPTQIELNIIQALTNVKMCDHHIILFKHLKHRFDFSELQIWWVYKMGHHYRKQIAQHSLTVICRAYLDNHPKPQRKRKPSKITPIASQIEGFNLVADSTNNLCNSSEIVNNSNTCSV